MQSYFDWNRFDREASHAYRALGRHRRAAEALPEGPERDRTLQAVYATLDKINGMYLVKDSEALAIIGDRLEAGIL
jgi:hypothetical protein